MAHRNRGFLPIDGGSFHGFFLMFHRMVNMVNSLPGFPPGCDDHRGLCYFDREGWKRAIKLYHGFHDGFTVNMLKTVVVLPCKMVF